jgi:hypothetical protein
VAVTDALSDKLTLADWGLRKRRTTGSVVSLLPKTANRYGQQEAEYLGCRSATMALFFRVGSALVRSFDNRY